MIDTYDKSDLVRVPVTFRNAAETPTDPTTVTFYFKTPAGEETSYVYGTDVELVRDSAGVFHVDVLADEPGMWVWRWKGTGLVAQADEGQFYVQPSDITGAPSAYAELRERVYSYVNDSTRTFITESDVDMWIQEGLDDISSRLRMSQGEVTDTTTGTIEIPADMVEPISLLVGSGYVSWVSDNTYAQAIESDIGPVARVFNGQVEVTPVPEETTYTLRYWSMASDTSLIRGNLKVRLVNYAVSRAKAKEGDFGASEHFLGLYERGLPAPSNASINQSQIPDGITFAFGPFDGLDAAHN